MSNYKTHPLHKDIAYRIVSARSLDVDKLLVVYEPLLRRASAPLYARDVNDYRHFGETMTGVWNKQEFERMIDLKTEGSL